MTGKPLTSRCHAGCLIPSPKQDGVFRTYESAGPESQWVKCKTCGGKGVLPCCPHCDGQQLQEVGPFRWCQDCGTIIGKSYAESPHNHGKKAYAFFLDSWEVQE